MNKKLPYLLICLLTLLVSVTTFAQTKTVLGKVVAKTRDLEGIFVKNITTNKSTYTQKGGYFSIEANPNDTLLFSAVHLVGRDKVLTKVDMNKALVFVPMEFFENVLDEVVINRKVDSETLGFGKVKRYTPAQRNLHRATSSGGGILPVDAIVNAISGRTKMLKKALELEAEQQLVLQILNKFPEEYYTNKLKIPAQYHMAFGYFMLQDPIILTSFQNVHAEQLGLMYAEKATEFLEIVKVLK